MNTADNRSIFIPYNIRDSDVLLPSLIRAAKNFTGKCLQRLMSLICRICSGKPVPADLKSAATFFTHPHYRAASFFCIPYIRSVFETSYRNYGHPVLPAICVLACRYDDCKECRGRHPFRVDLILQSL